MSGHGLGDWNHDPTSSNYRLFGGFGDNSHGRVVVWHLVISMMTRVFYVFSLEKWLADKIDVLRTVKY